jgi:hypothetical protein
MVYIYAAVLSYFLFSCIVNGLIITYHTIDNVELYQLNVGSTFDLLCVFKFQLRNTICK